MNESFEISGKRLKVTKIFGIIGVVLLLIVGCFLGQWIENLWNKETVTVAYISGKLEDMGELTTQKLTYSGIYNVSEGEIPLITKKGFTMWYNADVKASINFEDVDIKITKKKVTIKLPHAEIQSPEIIEDSIQFFDEKKAIFNWTEKTDITKAISEAEKCDMKKMDYSELLKQADECAETLLRKIFEGSVGKREVEISFK